jgi:hypothetical protein
MANSLENKIAVLVDGDNAEASLIEDVVAEAGRFGRVTVKRIYADWTSPQMKGWKEKLNAHAIRPIQKFAYTKAKNSTDTALIIDAMDLLHSKLVDGFCIVSSDSDYTGLAHRIREEGMFVMGIGRETTPEAFVKACSSFTYTEILSSVSKPLEVQDAAATQLASIEESKIDQAKKEIDFKLIKRAFQIAADINNGTAQLSLFAEELRKLDPTFDHRRYGYRSFAGFCECLSSEYETSLAYDGKTILISEKKAKES